MNFSKIVPMITVTMLIMLLIIPVQSVPTPHKRWTFNSWRFHGRRNAPLNPTTEFYSPSISNDVNYQDQPVHVDNDVNRDAYEMLLRLLQFFQMLEYEHEAKANGNN